MARKTIADLEKELQEERAKSASLQTQIDETPEPVAADIMTEDQIDLARELAETKELLAQSKSHNKESEARTLAAITAMEEESHEIVDGVLGASLVFTPDQYKEYSAKQGLIMGRRPNQVTKCSIEELRALINSNWTPSMVMEKHGMDAKKLQQLIWGLSAKELRDVPIFLSIERDQFGREG